MEITDYMLGVDGLGQLENLISEKEIECRGITFEKARAYQEDTNSWHDNFAFEDAQRMEGMVLSEIAELRRKAREAVIIYKHGEEGKVDIGDRIFLEEKNESFDVILTSKFIADSSLSEITINSPLGKALYKKTEGQGYSFNVGNRTISGKINKIERIKESKKEL